MIEFIFRTSYSFSVKGVGLSAPHCFTFKSIQQAITEAGFEPQLRNQVYAWRELPEVIEEQVIDY